MRAQLEKFFTREWRRHSGWQILLQPFAWLFAALTTLRRGLYRHGFFTSSKATVPVIVVGNISVGGTGKTPLVLALAVRLAAQGRNVGIVTRGYARDGRLSDEAALMSARSAIPVEANASRVAAVRQLMMKNPATDIVIADDGLQHYALDRDIEIAVVDGTRGFGNGYLLPAGPLREGVARLNAVDCIVVNNTSLNSRTGADFGAKVAGGPQQITSLDEGTHSAVTYLQTNTGKPVFEMRYGGENFSQLVEGQKLSAEQFIHLFSGKRIAAVAGIGNPQRFFSHLEALGIALHSHHPFSDHHPFVASDLTAIDADIVLMTEKDAVKCKAFADSRLWQMQIDAILPEAFYELIAAKLEKIPYVT